MTQTLEKTVPQRSGGASDDCRQAGVGAQKNEFLLVGVTRQANSGALHLTVFEQSHVGTCFHRPVHGSR